MTTWIALLRGINVGGRNKLPMKGLQAIFAAAGGDSVRTYIQSGNVIFDADIADLDAFTDKIGADIESSHGFRPAIHLLTAASLRDAIAGNPYAEAVAEPKTLHLNFLAEVPQAERIAKAAAALSDTERFEIVGTWLYLHAPDGIARSKFAGQVDRLLGVSTTARNWNTVTKLAAMTAR